MCTAPGEDVRAMIGSLTSPVTVSRTATSYSSPAAKPTNSCCAMAAAGSQRQRPPMSRTPAVCLEDVPFGVHATAIESSRGVVPSRRSSCGALERTEVVLQTIASVGDRQPQTMLPPFGCERIVIK